MKITFNPAPVVFAFTLIFISVTVLAATRDDIQYPVAELGNCDSEFKCGVYCGDPAHKAECDAFIEKYDLDEKAEKIKEIEFPIAELGNCGSRAECETYCDQPENVEACINFAKEHEIIHENDYEHADTSVKMARLVAEGKTPGGCQSEDACIDYCMADGHFDECIKFLEENDIVPEEQLEFFKKKGSFEFEGPGGCTGESECKDFCSVEANFDECVKFMEENGFIPEQELERLKKAGSFRGPGGCLMDECRDFCEKEENFEACVSWAHDNGMISDRDYDLAKKTGGKGPGGCVRDECQSYCENPDHRDECTNFACDNGFMTPEQCDQARRFASGEFRGEQSSGTFAGPGGCSGPEECKQYCSDPAHTSECGGPVSGPESGFTRGGEQYAGPGGCTGEECNDYCASHPEECGTSSGSGSYQPTPPEDYCKQYPEKCGGGYTGGEAPPTYEQPQSQSSEPQPSSQSITPAALEPEQTTTQ